MLSNHPNNQANSESLIQKFIFNKLSETPTKTVLSIASNQTVRNFNQNFDILQHYSELHDKHGSA